jgi:hypothetical protein
LIAIVLLLAWLPVAVAELWTLGGIEHHQTSQNYEDMDCDSIHHRIIRSLRSAFSTHSLSSRMDYGAWHGTLGRD